MHLLPAEHHGIGEGLGPLLARVLRVLPCRHRCPSDPPSMHHKHGAVPAGCVPAIARHNPGVGGMPRPAADPHSCSNACVACDVARSTATCHGDRPPVEAELAVEAVSTSLAPHPGARTLRDELAAAGRHRRGGGVEQGAAVRPGCRCAASWSLSDRSRRGARACMCRNAEARAHVTAHVQNGASRLALARQRAEGKRPPRCRGAADRVAFDPVLHTWVSRHRVRRDAGHGAALMVMATPSCCVGAGALMAVQLAVPSGV